MDGPVRSGRPAELAPSSWWMWTEEKGYQEHYIPMRHGGATCMPGTCPWCVMGVDHNATEEELEKKLSDAMYWVVCHRINMYDYEKQALCYNWAIQLRRLSRSNPPEPRTSTKFMERGAGFINSASVRLPPPIEHELPRPCAATVQHGGGSASRGPQSPRPATTSQWLIPQIGTFDMNGYYYDAAPTNAKDKVQWEYSSQKGKFVSFSPRIQLIFASELEKKTTFFLIESDDDVTFEVDFDRMRCTERKSDKGPSVLRWKYLSEQ